MPHASSSTPGTLLRQAIKEEVPLQVVGVAIALYPLSAFRAMNAAAECVFKALRKEKTQEPVIDIMQTRDRLYEVLDYHRYEAQVDELLEKGQK